MNYFLTLPKDILKLFVRDYIRPLDYHRLLRVSKIFHVLSDAERIEKEVRRRHDQRESGKTMRKYRKYCDVCESEIAKRPKRRHTFYYGSEKCNMLIERREKNHSTILRHLWNFLNVCNCGCFSSRFYFPDMAKHRETCDLKYYISVPDNQASYKWVKRLAAQRMNIERKRIDREKFRNQQIKNK